MRKYIILLLLITVVSIRLSAQQKVRGIVQDEYNNPLIGANILWGGTTAGTSTDLDGKFELAANPSVHKLVISYIGYITDTLIISDPAINLNITLRENTKLNEVVVRGKGMGTIQSIIEPLQVQKIGTAEFQRAACCNLSEAFETNASVDVNYADAATGAKQIKMLGLSNEYVQLMTENNPNFRGAVSRYGMDYIPGPWMESIQISKGASSVKNGYEAVAGQINVEYKKPYASDPLTINFFGSDNGRLEGNADGNIRLTEQLSSGLFVHYSNDKRTHDANKDGFLDRPKLEQINLMNRWNYRNGNYLSDFGVRYINDKRESGQTKHNTDSHTDPYEVNINTNRVEFFSKNAYILNPDKNQSIAFIFSGSGHNFKSRYGINSYDLTQNNLYANLIFETDFGIRHQLSSGLSMTLDQLNQDISLSQSLSHFDPARKELVFGGYTQYTYKPLSNLTFLAGVRVDHHNEYGVFVTPRLHAKYDPIDWIQLRASIGKGYRSVNVLAENNYLLASSRSRNLYIADDLNLEESLNWGISLGMQIPLFSKELNLTTDFYRTDFQKQVIADMESNPNGISFYNLNGKSYANSFQIEASYPLFEGFELRAAYKYTDTKITYNGILKEKALQSKHKGLFSASYQFGNPAARWQIDYTAQLNGGGRMPAPDAFKPLWNEKYAAYWVNMFQVSKFFKNWSVYLGAENLFNYTQKNPIIDAGNPYGEHFDATMIWGPVHGRSVYAGIRWAIPQK